MELLKLSRFKLQLRALISEVRDLRERERSSSEQLHLSIQRQKQLEEEFGRKLKELEHELALSIELRQKLERKVSYLQNDNTLLENKQKELNSSIQALLHSKEHFVNAYQESTYELRRSIETRDRKLKILSEKLKSHLLLFDSIEKEALSVKHTVDDVRHIVIQKEDVGEHPSLVSSYYMVIIVAIAVFMSFQVLDLEVRNLGAILEKLQHSFSDMYKDKKAFISIVESHESFVSPRDERSATPEEQMNRLTTYLPKPEKVPAHAEGAGRSLAFGIEPASSTTRSAWSGPESTNDAQSMFSGEAKSINAITVYQLESESSTLQAESSGNPG
ncbi:hypothetical protein KSS87_020269 [Heliosperma pusillum]|nr:hypothetical protein KSS87_020269 [Heliosperma pusillum]